MFKFIVDQLYDMIAPCDSKVGIRIFSIDEEVHAHKEESKGCELQFVVDPVILRFMLKKSNYLLFKSC
jgi:hypothetical protein